MPKKVEFNINLIPKDPFFASPIGKVLKWALSIGRYIVIFTELVVIVSFVTRFNLDRRVTDLNGSIAQKKTIISSYGDLEDNVKRVQGVLEQYDQLRQQVNITDIFPELTKIMPVETELSELIIRPEQISLVGRAYNQQALNTLISNIQLSQRFFNISVDKIASNKDSQEPGFEFVVRADTRVIEQQPAASSQTEEKVNILDRTQNTGDL